MKNVNLQQLSYFRIAMKCSSFSQAAKLAYTTQSTISKNISSLEATIGEPLFTRGKRGIFPTQRAVILNLELAEVYKKIDLLLDQQSYNQKNITIAFCQNIDFAAVVPEFFALFQTGNLFSEVDVKLHCYENNDVIGGVLGGSIDLGFVLSDTAISNPNIRLHTVVSSAPQIFYSVNSSLHAKENLTIDDFADFPLVTTEYLIEHNDYRMIDFLPFMPKGVKIVKSYNDIPIYLATGRYITLLRPYVTLAYMKDIKNYRLPNTYNFSQGITMIWSEDNKNQCLKKILACMM